MFKDYLSFSKFIFFRYFFSQFSKVVKNVKFYDPLAGSLRKTPTWFYLFKYFATSRWTNAVNPREIAREHQKIPWVRASSL